MARLALVFLLKVLFVSAGEMHALAPVKTEPDTMTRMEVRLSGPGIRPGSPAALPKVIYRAGESYGRIEDPPDAQQGLQKLTVLNGPDAYSANLVSKRGTHAAGQTSAKVHLPIVLPLDPKHKLGVLDGIEFGDELEFAQAAGAVKEAGPLVNNEPTDAYRLKTPLGDAVLVTRADSDRPITLTWPSSNGNYVYEYSAFEDVPFDRQLFSKPQGIEFREMPPDTESTEH